MLKKDKKQQTVKIKKVKQPKKFSQKKLNKQLEKNKVKPANFLVENLPYKFSPSYFSHNGMYGAIVQLYVRPGSNRQMTFQDVIDFIPTTTLSDVQVHLFVDDIIINNDEKKKIIRQNASMNKMTLEDIENTDGQKKTDDNSTKLMRASDISDYDMYELILDSAIPIVVFRWSMLVIGKTKESVEEQIQICNTLLDQNHEGAKWDSLPDEQFSRFTKLFDQIPKTRFEMTTTGTNYAGLQLAVNSGLNDPEGLPIGVDMLSLTNSTSYFDFAKFTKKQAVIATTRSSSSIQRFEIEDSNYSPSMSSIMAQYAAINFNLKGHRVHHIVLNDFDYFEKGRYYRPGYIEEIFKKYDVSKVTINPLQGFGEIEDVVQVYDRLIKKIVNIFDLMLDLQMSKDERAIILKAVDSFYINQQLWRPDADVKPKLTRIVNINKPDTYVTMGTLINSLSNLVLQSIREGRESKGDKIETLESILKQALSTHTAVLGRTTSIEKSNAPQIYYQFNNIKSLTLKQIQFINLIEYIIYTAQKDEVIIIHGFDLIQEEVAGMVKEAIDAAKLKGIKFIFALDSIKAANVGKKVMNDLFKMQNQYYNDLDSDMDWSFIGRVLPDELNLVKNALNQDLGLKVENQMLAKINNQILVHRGIDGINNFVALDPLL